MHIRRLTPFAASSAGMLMFWLLGNGAVTPAHVALLLAALAYAIWSERVFFTQRDRRLTRCFGIPGAAAAGAAAVACRLNACGATGWDGLAMSLLAALCLGPSAGQTMIWLMRLIKRCLKPVKLPPCKAFWLCLSVIVLCWLPVLLALFPGVTGYDMQSQISQIVSGEYVNGHPVAHTLLIGLFYRLGEALWNSPSLGVGLFMMAQALCLACSMAYALYWLCLRGCPRVIWLAILAVFAIAPQHAVMAASLTKDVLFAAVLLAVSVELCRWLTEPERACKRGTIAADLCLLTAAGLLRRNMVLASALVAILLVIRVRKTGWARRLLALLLSGMVLSLGCEAALKKAVDAEDPTIRDTLSMPCQQLARVYALYGLDHPVGYEIRETLPWAYAYAPERADAAKRASKITEPEQLVGFLKLWLRESVRYPVEYIDAFLLTNKAYWDIADTAYAYTYDDEEYGPRGVMTVNHNIYSNLEQYDLLPRVQQLCDEWFTENGCMQILPVRLIIHPALWTWLMAFGFAWAVYERRKAAAAAFALPAVYLCTLLLGPCALIRYCYCVMLAAPVLLGTVCTPQEEGRNHD